MFNKVVYVKAKFKPIGKWETVQVPTGEKKKGLFGEKEVLKEEKKWVQTGFSDCEVDGDALAQDITQAIERLNSEGYEVQTVLPVISGNHEGYYNHQMHYSYGYGYGWSYIEGAIIIAKRNQS